MQQLLRTDRFAAFLREPNLANYKIIRNEVLKHRLFDVHAVRINELARHFDAGRFRTVRKLAEPIAELMQISPTFHFFLGCSMLELGEHELAQQHRTISQACLQTLLRSGDGTKNRPYRPTYRSDSYDVMRAMGMEVRCQSIVDGEADGTLDVLTSHEGVDVWFDVSHLAKA